MPKRIFCPSNGPTGIRLKTARATLVVTRGKTKMENWWGTSLIKKAPRIAKRILLIGPATEMMAASRLGLARLYGSKGVGLPQP